DDRYCASRCASSCRQIHISLTNRNLSGWHVDNCRSYCAMAKTARDTCYRSGDHCCSSSASAFIQTSYWKDNEVLWRRTLAVTTENHTAETNLGVLLMERGKIDEALTHMHRAVE